MATTFAELPDVPCHPARIHQVLHNVLRNALQASHPGGAVAVRTSVDGECVLIEVEDHGCGIDPAAGSRIFEPFFSTRPVGEGRGLGLAISYGIVRDHGGSIDFMTEPGSGTTFRIRLPFEPG